MPHPEIDVLESGHRDQRQAIGALDHREVLGRHPVDGLRLTGQEGVEAGLAVLDVLPDQRLDCGRAAPVVGVGLHRFDILLVVDELEGSGSVREAP